MSNSPLHDDLRAQRVRNHEQRVRAIKRWVEYVEDHPPNVWGEQLNTLVDSQLPAAREADLPVDVYQKVEGAGDSYADRDE